MTEINEWRPNPHNGNHMAFADGLRIGTVFTRGDGSWTGVRNIENGGGVYLRGSYDTPNEAMGKFEQAMAEGPSSRLWSAPRNRWWQATKAGDGFYRRPAGMMLLTVKQATTGAWYATLRGDLLPGWHPTPARALVAAERALFALTREPSLVVQWAEGYAASLGVAEAEEFAGWQVLRHLKRKQTVK